MTYLSLFLNEAVFDGKMIKVKCTSVSLLFNLDVRNFNKLSNFNKPSSLTSSEESIREVID